MTTSSKTRPVATLRAFGGLKATIWGNPTDKGGIRYSVEFARTYKGGDEKLHDTGSFSATEALQVARLAEQAYDYIGKLIAKNKSVASNDVQH